MFRRFNEETAGQGYRGHMAPDVVTAHGHPPTLAVTQGGASTTSFTDEISRRLACMPDAWVAPADTVATDG